MSKFKSTQPHVGEPTEPLVSPLSENILEGAVEKPRGGPQPRGRAPRVRRDEMEDDDDDDDDDDDGAPSRGRSAGGPSQQRAAAATSFRRPTPGASAPTGFSRGGPKKSPFGNAASSAPAPRDEEDAPRPPRRPAQKGVFALVMYDFPGTDDDELPLREGQKVRVTRQHESGWWTGEINGKVGIFPATYVKLL